MNHPFLFIIYLCFLSIKALHSKNSKDLAKNGIVLLKNIKPPSNQTFYELNKFIKEFIIFIKT